MTIDKIIEEFKNYKIKVEGCAELSLVSYRESITYFCNDMNIKTYEELINVKAQTINDWIEMLTEKGNCANARNLRIKAIKQLFVFLADIKDVSIDNKIFRIKYAKIQKKESKYLTDLEMDELCKVITNRRIKAATILLARTGLRFSEMMQLTCADIDNGYAIINGKGNKQRKVWFDDMCIKYCKKFIEKKRAKIVKQYGINSDLLFINDLGEPLTKQSLTKSLKLYAQKIGIPWYKEMSPHKLRHSYITKQLNQGIPIQYIRDIVGHASIATTNTYAHSQEDIMKQIMLGESNGRK